MSDDATESPPVPVELRGAWRRTSIINADGTSDTASLVMWLQLEAQMVDVRIPTAVAGLADRSGLDDCSVDELVRLTMCEASTGFTTCTPVTADAQGARRATAEWITRGPYDIAYHPVTMYPEPGLLEWSDDGSVLTERAPSGAYVEEWRRVPGSDTRLEHRTLADGRRFYRTGPVSVVVRDRPTPLRDMERVEVLADRAGEDAAALASLVDIEVSIAQCDDDGWRVTGSTLPWKAGEVIDVGL